MQELTPNQKQIAVNAIGYDMRPIKQPNGNYRIEVWLGDEKCFGVGNIEYDDWQVGIKETYNNFYNKFVLKQN